MPGPWGGGGGATGGGGARRGGGGGRFAASSREGSDDIRKFLSVLHHLHLECRLGQGYSETHIRLLEKLLELPRLL